MRRTERAAYRTKFYSNLSSPTQFDEEPFLSGWFIHSCFLIIHNSNKRMSSSSFANDTLSSINI
ncbi:hypothetical protein B6S05_07005 [Enterococcus faecium]|nr:hypothetical protein B6S05_07005 [Enterococcus faecium]AWV61360.1 hypothetical protein B6S06_07010 [Enterococcus faecium]